MSARIDAMRDAYELDGHKCAWCGRRTDGPPHHLFVGEDRRIKENRAEESDAIMTLCHRHHAEIHLMPRYEVLALLRGIKARSGHFRWQRVLDYYQSKYFQPKESL